MNDNPAPPPPPLPGLPVAVLHPEFGDAPQMLNMRAWLQRAAEAAGATFTGGSVGMGEADIDIELEGCGYTIVMRPILKGTP